MDAEHEQVEAKIDRMTKYLDSIKGRKVTIGESCRQYFYLEIYEPDGTFLYARCRQMKLNHHDLNPYPVPKDKALLFVNEPWLIDDSNYELSWGNREPENTEDNVRVYIPLDINKQAILRRLDRIIARHGEANEGNESDFSFAVMMPISQMDIYDQIWYVRHMPAEGEHPVKKD